MFRLVVSPLAPHAAELGAAVVALRGEGVVAYPTETYYGLAADPRSASAVKKIFSLKRRPSDQPLPLIAASVAQVADHVGSMTPLARRLAARGWPGPLTLIIPASPLLCPDVHLASGKVAVRVPGHPVARALAEAAGHAITSTSANFSGEPPPTSAEQVMAAFVAGIDVLVDAGPTSGGLASPIVEASGEAPVLVRPGAVPWDRVLEFLL